MNKNTIWTQFYDMYSGGKRKQNFTHCYIEAPEDEAKIIFEKRFNHDPLNVTCSCCGQDYAITESIGLDQATGYERNCKSAYFKDGQRIEKYISGCEMRYIDQPDANYKHNGRCISVEEYINNPNVLVIYAAEI